jgi:hypothetical protein
MTARKAITHKIGDETFTEDLESETDTEFTDADFDSWTEEDEAAAIQEMAKTMGIRYIISEGRFFVARFPDGHIIKVPVAVSLDDFEALPDDSEGPVKQVQALLGFFGQEEDQEYLAGQNFPTVIDFASKYFDVFKRIAGASVGE